MGLDPSLHHRSEQPNCLQHRCEQMAAVLVNAGRVVPALETDRHGQLQARWWPLPAAADRPWLEAMLPADDLASQRLLADALAAAVDRCVRQRLLHGASSGSRPSQRSSSLPQAWLTALASEDGLLSSTTVPAAAPAPALTGDAETALLQAVAAWVRRGWRPVASCSSACAAMNRPMHAVAAGWWSCCCARPPTPACWCRWPPSGQARVPLRPRPLRRC
jgi:hypothetical protein